MTERRSFYRKIAYGLGIIVLLFPIFWLSAPATTRDAGGRLAELRDEHRLGQASIGDIDPASETMKLATLGLRGVAVTMLWRNANEFKKTEDWTSLTATLEQLAKLQPNFTTFWRFQSWNLSYNLSVEFDDYRDRYYWVRRGIEFLQKGEEYNRDSPRLLWDLGWFIGQKIGRADEYVQYRKLFREDDDFHPEGRIGDTRDNWLVGKSYYLEGVDAVDNKGMSLGKQSQRIFYESPAKSQMNYAEAIEEEGYFEKARRAWTRAGEEWEDFGDVVIDHSTGVKLQLGHEQRLQKLVDDLRSELDAMAPVIREKIQEEKVAALSDEERAIYETPVTQLTPDQQNERFGIVDKVQVTDRHVAERIAREHPDKEKEALRLATELGREGQRLQFTKNYKRDSNYDYWATRAAFEQTANAIAARRLMFRARDEFRQQDVEEAKKLYEEGFAKWRLVLDEFPSILADETTTADDILEYVKRYRNVLDQLDETIPDDFPLWNVIENFDREQDFTEEIAARKERQAAAGAESEATVEDAAPETAEAAAQENSTPPSPDNETTAPATNEDAAEASGDAGEASTGDSSEQPQS